MKSNNQQRWAVLTPLMTAVGHAWRRKVNQELIDHGLSASTAIPLLILMRNKKRMRQCTLAEKLGIEGPSLVRILDGLENSGFIERVADPTDRRARLLALSEAGQEIGRKGEEVLAGFRASMLTDIDPSDVDATIHVLTLLADRLGISPLETGNP